MNVPTNKTSVVGETVSDATIILAAVDPCYCCTERTSAIDRNSGKKVFTPEDLIRLSQKKTRKVARDLGLPMEGRLQGILK
jgi:NADH-quinone oxidoreductase subunit D